MYHPFLLVLAAILASLVAVSCQSTSPGTSKLTPHPPTPAPSTPSWTRGGSSGGKENQKYLITAKIIEAPVSPDAETAEPEKPTARVYTDPEFQAFVRDLSQMKGVDLMSTPSVVTYGGQAAKIEIGHFLPYPAEPGEDPPSKSAQTGITADFLVRSATQGRLKLQAHILHTEHLGMYEVSPDFFQPVFGHQQFNNTIELKPGETVVLRGLVSDKETQWLDKGPLGLIRTEGSKTWKSEFIAAVTVKKAD